MASSEIAATLIPGVRTAHSTLKLPLDLNHNENASCNNKRGSHQARVLEETCFIVWDKCTMSHRRAFEALDRTMEDIRKNSKHMGEVTLLLSGDFIQTLPTIPRGTPADDVNACLKNSYL